MFRGQSVLPARGAHMQAEMLTPAHFLLFLLLLPGVPGSSLSPELHKVESVFDYVNKALAEDQDSQQEAAQSLSKRGFLAPASGGEKQPRISERRTFPSLGGSPRSRPPAPTQPRRRPSLSKGKGNQDAEWLLSLDLQTHILNYLLAVNRYNAQVKENEKLFQQIGRRK